jgi:ubiquinone/menaquinone biosynthesis C-methylase UbiE
MERFTGGVPVGCRDGDVSHDAVVARTAKVSSSGIGLFEAAVNQMKNALQQRIRPIHEKFRSQKVAAFLEILNGQSSRGRLLDVGGGPGVNGEFLPLYAKFEEVVVVNLHLQNLTDAGATRIKELVADARDLPLESQSFDWVFSNAVIEHVGNMGDQTRFANEVRRVARNGYFVACPNKMFPIEPHTLLPFYQFLPISLQRKVAPFSPGYLKQYEEINLLTAAQLQRLFPEAQVRSLGAPIIGNSIVAYFKRGD